MKKDMYNVMIVDDMPDSTLIIQELLKNIAYVRLVCPVVAKAQDAYRILEHNEYHVDILLLDMDMPEINGEMLMGLLSNPPITVLCTGYAAYGFKAAEIGAKATLNKIPSLRVLRQVLMDMVVLVDDREGVESNADMELTLKCTDGRMRTVAVKDIYYASVLDKITTIYTNTEEFEVRMTLIALYAKLPQDDFVRCHKSFVVALDKVISYTAKELTIMDRETILQISHEYGQTFKKQMRRLSHKLQ